MTEITIVLKMNVAAMAISDCRMSKRPQTRKYFMAKKRKAARGLNKYGWDLVTGRVVLGQLHYLSDGHTGYHCSFTPSPAFKRFKPLFDQALSSDPSEHRQAHDEMDKLNLVLRSFSGGYDKEIGTFTLKIHGNEAWFRSED